MIQSDKDYLANLFIIDATGRYLYKQSILFRAGSNNLEIHIGQHPQGIYFLHYTDEYGKTHTVRYVKK